MNTATATYRKRKLNGRMNKSVQDPTCAQSFNKYAYCMNNPLRYTDPSGEKCCGLSGAELEHIVIHEAQQRCWREIQRMLEKQELTRQTFVWFAQPSSGGVYGNGDGSCDGNGYNTSNTSGPTTGDGNPTQTKKDGRTPETAMAAKNLFITCYVNYLIGDKQPIYVDASSMSEILNELNIGDFTDRGNGSYSINLFDYYSECPDLALALGNITLNSVGNDMYEINPDEYDFNIPSFNDLIKGEWSKRDYATFLGGLVHGTIGNSRFPIAIPNPGGFFNVSFVVPTGSFYIYFEGYVHINPRP